MKHSGSGGGGGVGVLGQQAHEGDKKCLNSELWHACAGPLVSLPTMGSRVVYFPQGHSEQVAATTNKEIDGHFPSYPSLPPQMICQLHNVTMHADSDTDEVYAQMTLQPLSPQEQKDTILPVEMGVASKQPTNYFCKTLTASDTSTHGGFSVPRRSAEKVFPPLDFSQQPPAQELIARDLHDVEWKFRHIFRGQPKRHLLTTGWSVFVSAKRLVAGDSVLFIWNEKNQLFLGIRHAVRPQTVVPSSVLSSNSMHIGLLAAAAHAAATNSCFTVLYNPRTSPSEFVIPLSKYVKAAFHTRVSVGMRFRMLFETEESSVRRHMGTITGISDLDSVRWPNSHWRSVKVGWDESTAGERQPRVSLWEVEPLTTFPMYPSMFPIRLKRPWHPGMSTLLDNRDEASNASMWLRGDTGEEGMHSLNFQPAGILPWMQQRLDPTMLSNEQSQQYQAMLVAGMQNDPLKQQFMQLQQSSLLQQQPSLLQQQQQQYQVMHQQMPQQILQAQQTQNLPENVVQHLLQQQHQNQREGQPQQHHQTYQDGFQIRNDQLQPRQQSDAASPSYPKSDFTNTNTKFSTVNSSGLQNLLSPTCADGRGDSPLNLSKNWHSTMLNDLPLHQPWGPRFAHPDTNDLPNSLSSLPHSSEKNAPVEPENYGLVAQNHTIFGVNIDSTGLLLPTTIPSYGASSNDADVISAPLGTSMFQNSMYNCINDDSSELLHSAVNIGSPNPAPIFVKVHKSGSVGRSLDISRISSYHQLREELGQMFGVEGNFDGPLRSGWQLVFVDREYDELLLGDEPWEVFVNNVWCIKILSPTDVQNMGKHRIEQPPCDTDAQDFVSKVPSVGSHEFGDDRKQWSARG